MDGWREVANQDDAPICGTSIVGGPPQARSRSRIGRESPCTPLDSPRQVEHTAIPPKRPHVKHAPRVTLDDKEIEIVGIGASRRNNRQGSPMNRRRWLPKHVTGRIVVPPNYLEDAAMAIAREATIQGWLEALVPRLYTLLLVPPCGLSATSKEGIHLQEVAGGGIHEYTLKVADNEAGRCQVRDHLLPRALPIVQVGQT